MPLSRCCSAAYAIAETLTYTDSCRVNRRPACLASTVFLLSRFKSMGECSPTGVRRAIHAQVMEHRHAARQGRCCHHVGRYAGLGKRRDGGAGVSYSLYDNVTSADAIDTLNTTASSVQYFSFLLQYQYTSFQATTIFRLARIVSSPLTPETDIPDTSPSRILSCR